MANESNPDGLDPDVETALRALHDATAEGKREGTAGRVRKMIARHRDAGAIPPKVAEALLDVVGMVEEQGGDFAREVSGHYEEHAKDAELVCDRNAFDALARRVAALETCGTASPKAPGLDLAGMVTRKEEHGIASVAGMLADAASGLEGLGNRWKPATVCLRVREAAKALRHAQAELADLAEAIEASKDEGTTKP